MREILFKAKRLSDDEWVEGYYIGPISMLDVYEICDIHDITGSSVEVNPTTVCEYTGLTDKHGVKIFEGDIMKFAAYGVDYKGAVTFINGNFGVLCKQASPFLDDVIKRGGTVIGNIHDNPELRGGYCDNKGMADEGMAD